MSPDQLSSHTTAHPTSPHLVIFLLIYSSLQEKRPFSDVTWHPVDLLEDFPCYDSPPVPITSVTAHHNSLPLLVAVILSNTFFLNSRFVFIWQFTSKASPGEMRCKAFLSSNASKSCKPFPHISSNANCERSKGKWRKFKIELSQGYCLLLQNPV